MYLIEKIDSEDLFNELFFDFSPYARTINSDKRFEAPIIFVGLTALSVDIKQNFSTEELEETSHKTFVDNTLFIIYFINQYRKKL